MHTSELYCHVQCSCHRLFYALYLWSSIPLRARLLFSFPMKFKLKLQIDHLPSYRKCGHVRLEILVKFCTNSHITLCFSFILIMWKKILSVPSSTINVCAKMSLHVICSKELDIHRKQQLLNPLLSGLVFNWGENNTARRCNRPMTQQTEQKRVAIDICFVTCL